MTTGRVIVPLVTNVSKSPYDPPLEHVNKRDKPNIADTDCGCGIYDPWGDFRYWFNIGILTILVIGLILGPILIYRKHKGEKGLWKKMVKWDLIYLLIVVVLWFIVNIIAWRIKIAQVTYY